MAPQSFPGKSQHPAGATTCSMQLSLVLTTILHLKSNCLQHVSLACYAERCISYDRFLPSVRLPVCHSPRIMSKLLKLRSWGLHWRIALWL